MKTVSNLFWMLIVVMGTSCGMQQSAEDTTVEGIQLGNAADGKEEVLSESVEVSDSEESGDESAEQTTCLNDIRFEGWSDEDWLDNDYIRELRSYIDAYCRGAIDDEQLNALQRYKSLMKSRFIIYDISPFLFGGVWVLIGFLENPKPVFEAWIYSEVNNANQVVSYEVRSFALSETITDFTKEHLLQSIKEHPELKLW